MKFYKCLIPFYGSYYAMYKLDDEINEKFPRNWDNIQVRAEYSTGGVFLSSLSTGLSLLGVAEILVNIFK